MIKYITDDERRRSENIYIFILFRYKYLQAIALTTGYNLLTSYNRSVPTDDILNILYTFKNIMNIQNDFDNSEKSVFKANWTDKYEANFTEVFGLNGSCFTFNFPGADEMFSFEE